MKRIELTDWQLAGFWPYTPLFGRSVETGVIHGGVTPSIPAKVPGTVQADLLRAGLISDPYYEFNSLLCEWVPERWWMYRKTFAVPKEWKGKKIRLTLLGIDYKAHIRFNAMPVVIHEGMYTHEVLDLTDYVNFDGENSLEVILESAPKEMSQIGYTSLSHTQKARFNYKWDFCTRLIHLGLYDRVFIEAVGEATLEESHVRYTDGQVDYKAVIKGEGSIKAELSYDGKPIGKAEGKNHVSIPVENPKLWYPNGYGEQPLYDLHVSVLDKNGEISEVKDFKVGLKTVEYVRCDGAPEDSLPYVPVVNGKKIYIKGVNCTPFDLMYGTVDRERYDSYLKLAKEAGVNLIRVWGGGLIEKEEFYDLCDEYGFMVWQEFIQSSSGIDNEPSELPEFLELLNITAISAIKEKRNHVSLTYWSGGNELYKKDSVTGRETPQTFESNNLSMLKKAVGEYDPDRIMLPSSPSGPSVCPDVEHPEKCHDIHGPWKYEGAEGQYRLYNSLKCQLHSEFGNDGVGNYETICKVLAPENQIVTTPGANMSWRHRGEWWDTYDYRDRQIFGEIKELSDFCVLSQYMQAEGLRYALEAHRRQAFENCGSIVWQFNEPWPNVSCTNLVDYYAKPKLAYFYFRDAMKPYHISMRYEKLIFRPGETLNCECFVHDDSKPANSNTDSDISVRIFDEKDNLLGAFGEKFSYTVPEGTKLLKIECKATDKSEGKEDTNVYLIFTVTDENPYADQKSVIEFVRQYLEKQ